MTMVSYHWPRAHLKALTLETPSIFFALFLYQNFFKLYNEKNLQGFFLLICDN